MSKNLLIIATLCGIIGAAGHFLIETWSSAIGFIIIASALNIFWNVVITHFEKKRGEID